MPTDEERAQEILSQYSKFSKETDEEKAARILRGDSPTLAMEQFQEPEPFSYGKAFKTSLKEGVGGTIQTVQNVLEYSPIGLSMKAVGKGFEVMGVPEAGPAVEGVVGDVFETAKEAYTPTREEQENMEQAGVWGLVTYGVGRLILELPQYIGAGAAGKAVVNSGFQALVKRFGKEAVEKAVQHYLPTIVKSVGGIDKAIGIFKEIPALQLGFGGLAAAQTIDQGPEATAKAVGHAFVTAPLFVAGGKAGEAIGGRVGSALGGALGFGGAALASGAETKEVVSETILGAGLGLAAGKGKARVQKIEQLKGETTGVETKLLGETPVKPEAILDKVEIERRALPHRPADDAPAAEWKKWAEFQQQEAKLDEIGIKNKKTWQKDVGNLIDSSEEWAGARTDLNWFTRINTETGHDVGDVILKFEKDAYVQAGKAMGVPDAWEFLYRTGGDEGMVMGAKADGFTKKTLDILMEKAQTIVREKEFAYEGPDGKLYTIKGVTFSYGTAEGKGRLPLVEAERGLLRFKEERKPGLGRYTRRPAEVEGISGESPPGEQVLGNLGRGKKGIRPQPPKAPAVKLRSISQVAEQIGFSKEAFWSEERDIVTGKKKTKEPYQLLETGKYTKNGLPILKRTWIKARDAEGTRGMRGPDEMYGRLQEEGFLPEPEVFTRQGKDPHSEMLRMLAEDQTARQTKGEGIHFKAGEELTGTEELPGWEEEVAVMPTADVEMVMEAAGGIGGALSKMKLLTEDVGTLFSLWKKDFGKKKTPQLLEKQGDITWGKTPQAVDWFAGWLPSFSSSERMGRSIKRVLAFPMTVAQKFPEAKPIFERGRKFMADIERNAWRLANTLKPMMDLIKHDEVNAYLVKARMYPKTYKLDEGTLRQMQFNDAQVAAILSHKATMDAGLDYMKDHLIEMNTRGLRKQVELLRNLGDAEKVAKVESTINEITQQIEGMVRQLRDENYFPASRFGKFWLYTRNAKGKEWYSFHETRRSMAQQARKFKAKGMNVKVGKVLKAPYIYEEIPLDLLVTLKDMWKLSGGAHSEIFGLEVAKIIAKKMGGAPEHLLRAKMVPGFSGDILRNDKAYIIDLVNWVEGSKARKDIAELLQGMVGSNKDINKALKEKAGLYTYWKNWGDYILKPTQEMAALRQFMFAYYLGGNVKSALLQLTQTATMTYPELLKYEKNSVETAGTLKRAMTLAAQYLKAKKKNELEAFQKQHKDVYDVIYRAHDEGELAFQLLRDLRAAKGPRAFGGTWDKTSDVLGWMFQNGEMANRYIAIIAGYLNAHKRGLKGEEAYEFARDFNDKTQGIYSKVNRPEIARGPIGAPMFIFRMYTGIWLSMLKSNMQSMKGDSRARAAVAAQLAVMGTLGGAVALPLAKELTKMVELMGFDPKKWAREQFGSFADLILHGVMYPLGWDMSGAVGLGELIPDFSIHPVNAIAKYAVGVPGDIPQRIVRAQAFLRLGQTYRAIESVLPEMLRGPAVAARISGLAKEYGADAGVRGVKGEVLIPEKDINLRMIILKSLNMQPSEIAKAYERENSEYILKRMAQKASGDLNFKMARALFKNDDAKVKSIIDYVYKYNAAHKDDMEKWITLDDKAIRRYLISMMGIEGSELREFPVKTREEYSRIQELYGEGRKK